jgi:hypothetical protein
MTVRSEFILPLYSFAVTRTAAAEALCLYYLVTEFNHVLFAAVSGWTETLTGERGHPQI